MRPRTTGPGVDPSSPATAAATATTPQPGARLSARSPAHARSGSGSASVPTRAVAATPTRAPSPAWHQSYPGCAPKLHALGARASSPTTAAAASSDSLGDYVAASPVAPLLGLTPSAVEATRSAQWDLWAERLTQQLQLPASLDAAARARVFQYYLPTYQWVLRQLEAHRAKHSGPGEPPALVIGISAPQGCGKTTLVASLQHLLNCDGHAAASVSIDDFYVRGSQQEELAAKHPDNGLLQFRGNPGTHDLDLAETTLETLRKLTSPGAKASVPTYDKSLRSGRGDRAPETNWPVVSAPLRVVLFEGWCLGFEADAQDVEAAKTHPGLAAVNAALKGYAARMERFCDAWIIIRVADPTWVFDWRLQAERQMRATGKPGLSDEQIRDFCERFQPAYKAYLPRLYSKGPTGRAGVPRLCLDVNSGRALVGAAST